MKNKNQQQTQSRNTGGSVERTFQLLQLLVAEGRAMTLAQIAEGLTIPKSTVHRLCANLVELRYLVRDVDERYYVAGPALHRLAYETLANGSSSRLRHKVLTDLVDEVGETCNLTSIDGASVLYLDRVEAERPWRLTMGVGVHVPLHCTASGKLFLSQMRPGERRKLLGKIELRSLTSNTITEIDLLEENLKEISSAGFATEIEEFIPGLIAIAVPIKDSTEKIRAAIAMHCSNTHVNIDQALGKLPALRNAADRISELLDV